MQARKATSLLALSLLLLIGGCSSQEPQGQEDGFSEGTLSSSTTQAETTKGPAGAPQTGPAETGAGISLRIEGDESTEFSGICTARNREFVLSGSPSKTYVFESRPLSCTIEKQDSGNGNLKVTVVAGDSARSVQQTSAEGGTIEVSYGGGS